MTGKLDFEPNLEKRVKPFNWQKGFPEVFKRGGFDAVIGNPPYIRIQILLENSPSQGDYFSRKYKKQPQKAIMIFMLYLLKGH